MAITRKARKRIFKLAETSDQKTKISSARSRGDVASDKGVTYDQADLAFYVTESVHNAASESVAKGRWLEDDGFSDFVGPIAFLIDEMQQDLDAIDTYVQGTSFSSGTSGTCGTSGSSGTSGTSGSS